MQDIIGMGLFVFFLFIEIVIFGEKIGDAKISIDSQLLLPLILLAIVLTVLTIFLLPVIWRYFRKSRCPRCGSTKRAVNGFGQLTAGEVVCGFCWGHYWSRGWRNFPENSKKISPQPVWFLLSFTGEGGIVLVVIFLFAILLFFLGGLTNLVSLIFLGKMISVCSLFVVVGLIIWQFAKIKWRQQILRWRIKAGVEGVEDLAGNLPLVILPQRDSNDPREYFPAIILGKANDRWDDVLMVKDVTTGEYKKILIAGGE